MDTDFELKEIYDDLEDTKENVDTAAKNIQWDVLKAENVAVHTIVDATEDSDVIDLDSDDEENNITTSAVKEEDGSKSTRENLLTFFRGKKDKNPQRNSVLQGDMDTDIELKEIDYDLEDTKQNVDTETKDVQWDVLQTENVAVHTIVDATEDSDVIDLDSDVEENNITTSAVKTIDEDFTVKEKDGSSTCSLDPTTEEEIKNICDNELIIYTKKLDDMIILNTIKTNQNVSFKKIMNSIELESKPKLNELVNKKTINQRFKKILDFVSLKDLIETLSKKANSDSLNTVYRNRNNRPVLNMCRRVNVTLIDYRLYSKMTNLKGDELHDKIYLLTKSIQARSRRMYRKNPYLRKNNLKNSDQLKTVFSLLDKEMKRIEHYLINASGDIVSVENEDISNDNDWEELKKSNSVFEVCCWYKREFLLNHLCKHVKHLPVFRMISKKHNCPVGKCNCCKNCKAASQVNQLFPSSIETFSAPSLLSSTNIDKSNMKLKDLLNIEPRMLNFPRKSKSLIDKALEFSRSQTFKSVLSNLSGNIKQDANKNLNKTRQNWMRNRIIVIKSIKIKDEIEEIYDIGNDGELLACQKNIKHTVDFTHLHSGKYDLFKILNLYKVCCWNKRENLIDELLTKNLSPEIAKQIRHSHVCPIDNCKCCCYKIDKVIDKIVYPHSPRDQNMEVARMCNQTSMNQLESDIMKPQKKVLKLQKKSVASIINEANESKNKSHTKSIVNKANESKNKSHTKSIINKANELKNKSDKKPIADQHITEIRKNTATTKMKTCNTVKRNNHVSHPACPTNPAVELGNASVSSLHVVDNANAKHDESKTIHIDPQIMVKINQTVKDMLVKFQSIQLSENQMGQVTVLMNDINNVNNLSIFEVTFLKLIMSQAQDIIDCIKKSPEKDINDIIGVRSKANQRDNIPVTSQTQFDVSAPENSKTCLNFHNSTAEKFASETNSNIDIHTNATQRSVTTQTYDTRRSLMKNITILPKVTQPETVNSPNLNKRPRFIIHNKEGNSSNMSKSIDNKSKLNLPTISNTEEFINKQMQILVTSGTSGNGTNFHNNMLNNIVPISKFSILERHLSKPNFPSATVVHSEPSQIIPNLQITKPNNYITLQEPNLQSFNINPPLLSNVAYIPNDTSASLPLLTDLNIQNTSTFNIPNPTFNLPNPTFNMPNSTVNIPNPTVNIPNPTFNIPNPTFNIPNQSFEFLSKQGNVNTPNNMDNSEMIKIWYRKPDDCDDKIESLKRQLINDFENSNFKKIKLPLSDPYKQT